jgi:hypothetical protein
VDAKLQQTTQLIKEADEKHQREREFVSSISLKKKKVIANMVTKVGKHLNPLRLMLPLGHATWFLL